MVTLKQKLFVIGHSSPFVTLRGREIILKSKVGAHASILIHSRGDQILIIVAKG